MVIFYTMNKLIAGRGIIEVIAALLILLFLYTGLSKLHARENFFGVLSFSPLIKSNAYLLSWVIPIVEILIGALLFFPVTRKMGFISSFILMIFFTACIAYMLLFSSNLPCACGGVLRKMSWPQHLVFNIFFTGLSAWGLWLCYKQNFFIAIKQE